MPKVSVIIPNYNHGRFLENRIDSILRQTYQDFEIIYLDDASTDNSSRIFEKFSNHPKIRSVINEINSGSPFKQWNKGLKLALGNYVWIAESDDLSDSNFLETLVNVLDSNPNVGLVYCQSSEINENSEFVSNFISWTDDLSREKWRKDYINSGLNECENYLSVKNTIPNASAVLVRKNIFERINYADESMRLCGDWMTWIKLLLHCDIAFIAKALNFYRTHSHTVRLTSTFNGKNIVEKSYIHAFLRRNFPSYNPQRLETEIIQEWADSVIAWNKSIGFSRNLEIYRNLSLPSSNINMKLMTSLIHSSLDRINNRIILRSSQVTSNN